MRMQDLLSFYLINLLADWLKLKREGKNLGKYFEDNYIKKVAIYGLGNLGQEVYWELSNLKDIKVLYGIDKNAKTLNIDGLKIISLDETLEEVDAVIVTPLQYYNEIEESLNEKGIKNVISIGDIVRYCV